MIKKIFKVSLFSVYFFTSYVYFFSQTIFAENARTTPYYFLGEQIDFELFDMQEISHKVSDYRGKECVICFIKSSIISERCLLINYLSNIYNWLKEHNIMLICVSTEPIAYYFAESNFIPFPILLDRDRAISKKYCTNCDDIFSIANTTFILDKNGVAVKILNVRDVGDLGIQIMIHAINSQDLSGENKNNIQVKKDILKTEMYRLSVPDFQLFNHDGKLIKLSDYRGKWCLVAFANKINNSSEYQNFLYLLNNIYPWLKQQDVEIVCASTESVNELARFKNHSDLRYCLLSDSKCLIPELFKESWSYYNEFLSYLIDPEGNKVASFISGSSQLHFAQLCRYFIIQNPTATSNKNKDLD